MNETSFTQIDFIKGGKLKMILEIIEKLEGQYLNPSEFMDEMAWPSILTHPKYSGKGAGEEIKRVAETLHEIMFNHGRKNGTLQFLPLDQLLEHPGGNGIGKGLNDAYFDPVKMLTLGQDMGFNGVAVHPGWAQIHKSMGLEVPMILKVSGSSNYGAKASGRPQSDLLVSDVAQAVEYYGAKAVGYTYYMGSPSQSFIHRDFARVVEGARKAGVPLIVWAYPRGSEIDKVGANSPTTILGAVTAALSIGADIVKINIPSQMSAEQLNYAKEKYSPLQGALSWQSKLMESNNVLEILKYIVTVAHQNGVGVITSGGSKSNAVEVVDRVKLAMNAGADGIINGRNVSTTMDDVTGSEAVNQMSQVEIIKATQGVLDAYPRVNPLAKKDGE